MAYRLSGQTSIFGVVVLYPSLFLELRDKRNFIGYRDETERRVRLDSEPQVRLKKTLFTSVIVNRPISIY